MHCCAPFGSKDSCCHSVHHLIQIHLVSQSKIHQLEFFILLIILVLSFLRALEGVDNRLKVPRVAVQSLYAVSCTITADT